MQLIYANMFIYYSVYDGAADKAKVKCQFEQMTGQNCRRNETVNKSQALKTQSR